MNRGFDRIAVWIVDRRPAVVVLLGVISLFAGLGHYDSQLLRSLFTKPRAEAATVSVNPDGSPLSQSAAGVVVVARSGQFFTADGARAMRLVVERLEDLDQVASVLWMDNVPVLNIFGLREPILPRSEASERRFAAAREKALTHPLVVGQLLSQDAGTLVLRVTLDPLFVFSNADATTHLREVAEAAAAEFPEVDVSFQVTGLVPAYIDAIEAHQSNRMRYQLIGYGMTILMTIVLFRGIAAMVIVALAPTVGVVWTLGMIRYIDYGYENGLVDVVLPLLVAIVGLTDGVHLMVEIRRLRHAGFSERDAARGGLRRVGLACFLTSLTTAIGFGSLTMASSDFVRDFGVCCVIGVTLSFIAVVTVIPLACSTRFGRNIHEGHDRSLIDRSLTRIGGLVDFVLRHQRSMSLIGILVTVALCGLAMTLKPDQRLSDRLPVDAESTQAIFHLDQALGGLEFSAVAVRWSDRLDSRSPDILLAVRDVDRLLRSEELIGHPLSICNLIDAQPGSGPPEERMSLLDLLPPPLKQAFYSPEEREATVTFRVQDVGIARYAPVFERIVDQLHVLEQRYPQLSFALEGDAVNRSQRLYTIVTDLAASLGTASVIIFAVLSLVYRSLRLGLISVVPNVFPLAVSGAWLALSGYNLEVVMVCCFTVCLGIAVDDTIHFLTRYQQELPSAGDVETAIRSAFTGVGSALIMTTTVLVAGFSTVTISGSRDHRIFATMGVLTIAAALFGDLIFLPALLARFAGQSKYSRPASDSADRTARASVVFQDSSVEAGSS